MIENYRTLPLGTYMKINAVLMGEGEELEKQVQIIAILADKSPDEVLLLPLDDYAKFAAQTAFLREPCEPADITPGWRYGDLIPTADFRKINTAQYIDFQTFSKNFPASLPELLSVFLVPDGHAYNDGYDIAEVQQRVRAIPFPVALGLAAFFFVRFSELIADSLTSLDSAIRRTKDTRKKEAMMRKMREAEELLRSVGVGLPM